jgi:hypothetical protein
MRQNKAFKKSAKVEAKGFQVKTILSGRNTQLEQKEIIAGCDIVSAGLSVKPAAFQRNRSTILRLLTSRFLR